MSPPKSGAPLRKKASVRRQSSPRKSKAGKGKRAAAASDDVGNARRPLIHAFVSKGAAIDVEAVASSFGMSKRQIAETIGINRAAFYKRTRTEAPKTQTRLGEMLEILSRVSDWAGGKERAMAWYRAQPIAAFGGRTAESLVKSGEATAVRDYLDHIAIGGYA